MYWVSEEWPTERTKLSPELQAMVERRDPADWTDVDTPQRNIMDITGDSTEIASEIDGAVEGVIITMEIQSWLVAPA